MLIYRGHQEINKRGNKQTKIEVWNPTLTSLHLCNTRHSAVAVVGNTNDFHVVRATAQQRGHGAVRLIGAAGELVVS